MTGIVGEYLIGLAQNLGLPSLDDDVRGSSGRVCSHLFHDLDIRFLLGLRLNVFGLQINLVLVKGLINLRTLHIFRTRHRNAIQKQEITVSKLKKRVA
jgi:hypothetical protein